MKNKSINRVNNSNNKDDSVGLIKKTNNKKNTSMDVATPKNVVIEGHLLQDNQGVLIDMREIAAVLPGVNKKNILVVLKGGTHIELKTDYITIRKYLYRYLAPHKQRENQI